MGVLNVSMVVRDSLFSTNAVNLTASRNLDAWAKGGGIYYEGASLDVESTTFTSNSVTCTGFTPKDVDVSGGAVHAYMAAGSGVSRALYSFRSSRFTGNQASLLRSGTVLSGFLEAHGGAIRAHAQVRGGLNVTACVFLRNSVYFNGTTSYDWGAGGKWLGSSPVCLKDKCMPGGTAGLQSHTYSHCPQPHGSVSRCLSLIGLVSCVCRRHLSGRFNHTDWDCELGRGHSGLDLPVEQRQRDVSPWMKLLIVMLPSSHLHPLSSCQ